MPSADPSMLIILLSDVGFFEDMVTKQPLNK